MRPTASEPRPATNRRKRTFLATWLLIIVAVLCSYAAIGSSINSEFTIPGSSSQTALDELQKTLPPAAGTSAQIVFQSPAGSRITDASYHAAVEATLAQAKTAPQVTAVVDPFASKAISRDGRTALAQIQYTVSRPHLGSDSLPALHVRVPGGRRPAAADSRGRSRRRRERRVSRVQHRDRVVHGSRPGVDDRPRRRHRLLGLHPLPVPVRAGRRPDRPRRRQRRLCHRRERPWCSRASRSSSPWPVVLAIPALSLRLALADNGSAATDATQRQAYDLVSTEFGPGFNAP